MVVLLQICLQVVNHVTLVVAQNTVDYEALDLYTVNVSLPNSLSINDSFPF